jgi:hypothetical protein
MWSVNVIAFKEVDLPDCTEQKLNSLLQLSKSELIKLWRQLLNNEPPLEIRKALLRRVLAYRLQEQQSRGLGNTHLRRLRQLATALEANPNATVSSRPPIKPGTRLVREWKQQVHTVEVRLEGYDYNGAHYESLSEIARLITGTRWSGPAFFGLKAKHSSESVEAQ